MAKIPYLIRRNNVFYFRLGVPVELREVVKSREIIQSLRTQNSKAAARKALTLAAHFKALLHTTSRQARKAKPGLNSRQPLAGVN